MCGIVGLLNRSEPRPASVELMGRMIGMVRHRGPEQSGLYRDAWCALGHARLNIIDLSGGGQPIHNEDRTLWIVYNGEVFNHVELRRELEARGHQFYTRTDTEVILHLYEERGAACLEELNGQFAFAIWDAARRELFLARDRVGICPLHYAFFDGRLIFASELKAILAYPGFPRQLDPEALNQVFNYWTTLPGRSAFTGINELPAGHCMTVSDGGAPRLRRYWEIPMPTPEEQLDLPAERLEEAIRELLTDAVRIRLRADVPVGCYLSGGLDSSSIAGLVVRNFNGGVRTFGIRFRDPRFDEGLHQERMAAHLGVDHHTLWAEDESIGACLEEAMWHIEKPLLRTAPIPLFLLSGEVRRCGYKVVLTGEGADEIFGGYNIFRETKVRRFWSRQPGSALRPLLIGRLYPYIFNDPRLQQMLTAFFGQNLLDVENPFYSHAIRWRNTARIRTFIQPELQAAFDPEASLEGLRGWLPERFGALDPLCKAQYLEMLIFLSNYLLCSQGDRVAMAHAVELRVPFLDHRVIELALRMPSNQKIRGMREKHILRAAMRGVALDSVIERNKQPYRAPIRDSLFAGRGGELAAEYAGEAALRKAGIFEPRRVGRLIEKMRAAEAPSEVDSMALIGVISTQILQNEFVARFPWRQPEAVQLDLVYEGDAAPELARSGGGEREASLRSGRER